MQVAAGNPPHRLVNDGRRRARLVLFGHPTRPPNSRHNRFGLRLEKAQGFSLAAASIRLPAAERITYSKGEFPLSFT
jgi:hypothetical protein